MAATPSDAPVATFLTEDRLAIQEQAREFTLTRSCPVANKLDPEKGDIPMDLATRWPSSATSAS